MPNSRGSASTKGIVFDFDGVFTDNSVIVSQDGTESVICSRSDGLGLSKLRALGIPCTVISTETNPVVSKRCEKLRIDAAIEALWNSDALTVASVNCLAGTSPGVWLWSLELEDRSAVSSAGRF